jgi:hypothetical protein
MMIRHRQIGANSITGPAATLIAIVAASGHFLNIIKPLIRSSLTSEASRLS